MDLRKLFKAKNQILISIKFIYLLMLFYQIILLSIDYLNFPYNVKLEIINDKNYLPAITICAKNFFVKNKVKLSLNNKDMKNSHSLKIDENFNVEKSMNESLEKFSVDKLELTITAKELINCSANLYEFKSFKRKKIGNCIENTRVIESIYGRDLGKCFTYFVNNSFRRESVVFRGNDFIQFKLDVQTFDNLLDNSEKNSLTIFIHDQKIFDHRINEGIKYYENNYQEFEFRKTKVNYLSWPYMNDCDHYSGN
jgi:hypothetical protein